MERGPNFGGVYFVQHPMKKVSYLNYEYCYQFVVKIFLFYKEHSGFWCSKAYESNYSIAMPFGCTLIKCTFVIKP